MPQTPQHDEQPMTPAPSATVNVDELTSTISRIVQETVSRQILQLSSNHDNTITTNLTDRLRRASAVGQEPTSERIGNKDIITAMRDSIHDYDGKGTQTKLLDFIRCVSNYLKHVEGSTQLKFDFVTAKLKGTAASWLEQVNRDNADKPIDTWETLKAHLLERFTPPEFERQVLTKLQYLRQGNMTVEKYSELFQELVAQIPQLRNIELVNLFVNGLNTSISTLLRTHDDNLVSFEAALKAAHRQEQALRPLQGETKVISGVNAVKTRPNITCQLCGGGHYNNRCPQVQEFIQSKLNKTNSTSYYDGKSAVLFLLDSGCSQHMVNSADLLCNLVSNDTKIVTADGTQILVKQQGTLRGSWNGNYIEFQDVLLATKLSYSLLSVQQLCDSGYKIMFCSDKTFQITKENLILHGIRKGSSYYIPIIPQVNEIVYSAQTNWHSRLGHFSDAKPKH